MIIMIILLILCLPLILMLSLYTTTSMVAIAVDVPVSGIEVFAEELIELDLDKGETYTVDYIISPTEASNKNIRFIFEDFSSDVQRAEFTVDGNTLIPTRAGAAKVTVATEDGDMRDSFFIRVKTNTVSGITSALTDDDGRITVGQTTGISTSFYPQTARNKGLSYRVIEGADVATVAADGSIRGIGVGTAKIEVTSTDNPQAKSVVEIAVDSSGVFDFVYDRASLTSLQASQNSTGEFLAVLNPDLTFTNDPTIKIYFDGEEIDTVNTYISVSYDNGRIIYDVLDPLKVGQFEIEVTMTSDDGQSVTKSCYLTQVSEIAAEWADDVDWNNPDDVKHPVNGAGAEFGIDLSPAGADVTFKAVITYHDGSTEELVLTVGETYALENGYLSITVYNSVDGAYLKVTRNKAPMSEDEMDLSSVHIKLFIEDNLSTETEIIELPRIGIAANPG